MPTSKNGEFLEKIKLALKIKVSEKKTGRGRYLFFENTGKCFHKINIDEFVIKLSNELKIRFHEMELAGFLSED